MEVPAAVWIGFVAFVLSMLTLDLFVFHREAHAVSTREAAMWTAIWMSMGIGFTAIIWRWQGGVLAGQYITGYLLEYSLSADNIFVFVLIFSYFAVPSDVQHRVLFWGILGALVFRAAFIIAGAALLARFHFMFYVFGAFLVYTGIRMARHGEVEVHPDKNIVLRLARRLYPMTPTYQGQKFFVKEGARRMATPLLAVLIVVETTDIIFAVDSIPAIFGVTREPFLVFTSNAFAIMGLRALYFLLANMVARFQYLQVGLAAILVFIGSKMIFEAAHDPLEELLNRHLPHVPIYVSLGFIVTSLTIAIVLSLRRERRDVPGTIADELPPTEIPPTRPIEEDDEDDENGSPPEPGQAPSE